MDSHLLAVAGDQARDRKSASPVRAGAVPPLADCFSARPETGAGLADGLVPGQVMVLTEPEARARQPYDWPGGTGKTQLAVHLTESLWQAHQVDLLLWVTATSRASVLASYVQAFAATTGTDPAGDAETVAARFTGWLAQTSQRWLIVLDDLTASADLTGLWPKGPAGRVLVTTRSLATLTGAGKPHVFPIGPFSSHEALTYLMARLSVDPDQRAGAVDLLDDLGRVPIVLAQASAMIASSGLSCRDYRELFVRSRERIADTAGGQPAAKAVTWTLSVEHADQLSPGRVAQSCLALTALLDCYGIPGEVFSTAAACEYIMGAGRGGVPDPKGTRSALISLERAGLLIIDDTSDARMVRVHPVVQAAVRSAMPDSMREQAAPAAARALLQAWPADGAQPWAAGAFRSCAASLQQTAGGALWAGDSHAVLFQAGDSMDSAGLTGPAVAHWQAVAAASERALGPAHRETLRAIARLSSALVAAGRGAEAVALCRRMVDARARALGSRHPGTVLAQADLGSALLKTGRPGDAIIALEGVLAATERGVVPDGLDLPAVQDALAAAYRQAGRHPDAIRLARQALSEQERRQGDDHPDTLSARANLASACLSGGRLKEAVVHAKRALADRERVLGPDDPDTLASLSVLATAYHSARRYKEALPLFERALRDRERVLGRDHSDTLGAQSDLASAYHSAGRMASALPLYERSRADCQRVLGACHPDTLAARANLAQAYAMVGRVPDAVALLRVVAGDCERELPHGHPLAKAVRESLQTLTDD